MKNIIFIIVAVLLAGCAILDPYPDTQEMAVILDVHKQLRHQFRFRETNADCQSYADEILAGKVVTGVCRHYAPTAVDLLTRRGIEAEAWILEQGGEFHMVALAAGEWVLDGDKGLWPKAEYDDYKWVNRVWKES